ncbi:MAG: hypothetical protein O6829_08620 [Alphaproteobacteria bacterium]|nr:hypothetical protein [Alphaproteobacteria bacterium]
MEGRGDENPPFPWLGLDQPEGDDGIFVGVAGLVLEQDAVRVQPKIAEKGAQHVGLLHTLADKISGAPGEYQPGVRVAARQGGKLGQPFGGPAQGHLAPRHGHELVDDTAQRDDPVDPPGQVAGHRKAVLEGKIKPGAEGQGRHGEGGEDGQAHQPPPGAAPPGPQQASAEAEHDQQQVAGIDDEPCDLGNDEKHV